MNTGMHDEQYKKIKESGWRRPLTAAEQATLQKYLASNPEDRPVWSEEAALNQLLERLPKAPVSSNFTARLMQAVPSAPPPRRAWLDWLALDLWLPEKRTWRVAMCTTMLGVGLLSFYESQAQQHARLARDLAGVSRVAALPPVEWLKDFDTINKISQVKVADDDLLAALQ